MNEVEMRVALRRARAHWVTRDTFLWDVPPSPDLSVFFLHAPADLDPSRTDLHRLPMTPSGAPSHALRERFPHLAAYSAYTLPPEAVADARWLVGQALGLMAVARGGEVVAAVSVQIPGVLDDLFPYDGPLGIEWTDGVPTLRLWAPTARAVALRLFDGPRTPAAQPVPLNRDESTGVWSAVGTPAWNGKFYVYEIEVYVPSTGKVERNLVTDPYSVSLSTNSRRSQIVDMRDPALAPPGWEGLAKPPLEAPEDIVIYELHARDFSIRDATVPELHRGTFKAFSHLESSGMAHLRALAEAGLTHVHLLPVLDFASVNEERAEREEPDPAELAGFPPDSDRQAALCAPFREKDGFNWGYDPFHFLAVEGSYSTDPDGPLRILELREAIQSLAKSGLRVVLDVVFNHTYAHGQSPYSVLDRVVPGYYHRLEADGKVESSTCCSNTASEHRMMERLMVDAVVHWARNYKVDGFRFDVMGHHMVSNMLAVREALGALTLERDGVDGGRIYVYGEGWDFGEVANNARGRNATQLNMAGTGIGTFSDRMRDAVRGGGAFSGAQEQGLATGLVDDPNDFPQGGPDDLRGRLLWYTDLARLGLAGNLRDFVLVDTAGEKTSGAQLRYHDKPAGYAHDPQEHVVYVSAHDNETLFDAIQWKAPLSTPMEDRVRMNTLATSFVMLAQGVPFFHAGDDMLRSKSLDRNSYDSGDWWNALDFTGSTNNWGVGLPPGENERSWRSMRPLLANPALKPSREHVLASREAFRELLRIRKSSRLFRLRTAEEVQRHVSFLGSGADLVLGLIVLVLDNRGPSRLEDPFDRIVACFNTRKTEVDFSSETVRGAALALHEVQAASADPQVRTARFEPGGGRFVVPPRTTAVFVELAGG
jgi:pullulanase